MRRRERRRRYQDVLDSIARLEYELGLTDVPPPKRSFGPRTPEAAAAKWTAAASASAAQYTNAIARR